MVKAMSSGLKILTIKHFSSLRTKLMALFTQRAGKHMKLLCQVFSAHKKKTDISKRNGCGFEKSSLKNRTIPAAATAWAEALSARLHDA